MGGDRPLPYPLNSLNSLVADPDKHATIQTKLED